MSSTQKKGFSAIELLLAVAVFIFLISLVFAFLSDSWRDARDQKRIADLAALKGAFESYRNDLGEFPSEETWINGDIAANVVLQKLLEPYIASIPHDPAGEGDRTFFYYYDGSHRCGNNLSAVIFARRVELSRNSNYQSVVSGICDGAIDEEGRGGGDESYTVILGPSGEGVE